MSTTRINSSIYPSSIDTDNELLHAQDRLTAISALGLNSLKDSILQIEETLGINPQGGFLSILDRLDQKLIGAFIRKTGDDSTGSIAVTPEESVLNIVSGATLESSKQYIRNAVAFSDNDAAIILDWGNNLSTGIGSFRKQFDFTRIAMETGQYNTVTLSQTDPWRFGNGVNSVFSYGGFELDEFAVGEAQFDNATWIEAGEPLAWEPGDDVLYSWDTALTIIGNSAIDSISADMKSDGVGDLYTHKLRRIRLFDDVEVVNSTYLNEANLMTPLLIVDNQDNIDPMNDPDFFDNVNDVALFVENTLDIHGQLFVRKPIEVLGYRQQRFAYDPEAYTIDKSWSEQIGAGALVEKDETGVPATKLSQYLLVNPQTHDRDFNDVTTSPRQDLLTEDDGWDRNGRDILSTKSETNFYKQFTNEVSIPANTDDPYNFLIVYFGGTMVMRGGLSLYIREDGGSKQEIKWPNVHNFNLHDLRMGSDLYSLSGQAIISRGTSTRGTSWNGRDASSINLGQMAAFNNSVDNSISISLSVSDAPNKEDEVDWLVSDWNSTLAGRDLSSVEELSGFPKRWPYRREQIYNSEGDTRFLGFRPLPSGSKVTVTNEDGDEVRARMIATMRNELQDIMPYEAYYPYLFVIGVRDTVYEIIS